MNLFKTLLVFLVVVASAAAISAQSDYAAEVQKLERAWLDAYEKLDARAMDSIVAEGFSITFPDGSVLTKPQVIASLQTSGSPQRATPKFHTEDVQARVFGETVILTGRVVTAWQRDGQTVSKQQQRYTDTYVKRDGSWQVVASHLSNVTPNPKPAK